MSSLPPMTPEEVRQFDQMSQRERVAFRLQRDRRRRELMDPGKGSRVIENFASRPQSAVDAAETYVRDRPMEFDSQAARVHSVRWNTLFTYFFDRALAFVAAGRTPIPEDLVWFSENAIDALAVQQSYTHDKSGISDNYYSTGMKVIDAYYVFYDPDWKLSPHQRARIRNTTKGLRNEKRLYNGKLDDSMRIDTLSMIKLITHSWYQAFHYGTNNWDMTIYTNLFAVLMLATGARIGDLVTNTSSPESALQFSERELQCLQYRHLCLKIPPWGKSLADATLQVELEFTKGRKNSADNQPIYQFVPLETNGTSQVDPIAIVVGYALRSKNVAARTVDEVVQLALRSPNGILPWKYPNNPVLHAWVWSEDGSNVVPPVEKHQHGRTSGKPRAPFIQVTHQRVFSHQPNYSRVADQEFLRTRFKVLANSMGFFGLTPHAVRRGFGKDVARHWRNAVDPSNAQVALGHSEQSIHSGATKTYTGEYTYNEYAGRIDHFLKQGLALIDQSHIHTHGYDLAFSVKAPIQYGARSKWMRYDGGIKELRLSKAAARKAASGDRVPLQSVSNNQPRWFDKDCVKDVIPPLPPRAIISREESSSASTTKGNESASAVKTAIPSEWGVDFEDDDEVEEDGPGETLFDDSDSDDEWECWEWAKAWKAPVDVQDTSGLARVIRGGMTEDLMNAAEALLLDQEITHAKAITHVPYDPFTTNYDEPVTQDFKDIFKNVCTVADWISKINHHTVVAHQMINGVQLTEDLVKKRCRAYRGGNKDSRDRISFVWLSQGLKSTVCPSCWRARTAASGCTHPHHEQKRKSMAGGDSEHTHDQLSAKRQKIQDDKQASMGDQTRGLFAARAVAQMERAAVKKKLLSKKLWLEAERAVEKQKLKDDKMAVKAERAAEKQKLKDDKMVLQAERAAEKQKLKDDKMALQAERAAEKKKLKDDKLALKADRAAEKQKTKDDRLALKADRAAEKQKTKDDRLAWKAYRHQRLCAAREAWGVDWVAETQDKSFHTVHPLATPPNANHSMSSVVGAAPSPSSAATMEESCVLCIPLRSALAMAAPFSKLETDFTGCALCIPSGLAVATAAPLSPLETDFTFATHPAVIGRATQQTAVVHASSVAPGKEYLALRDPMHVSRRS